MSHKNHRNHKIFGLVPTKMSSKNVGRTEAGIVGAACMAVGGPILFKGGEAAAKARWLDAAPEIRDNPAKAKK